jgi:hypothetical protein
MEPVTPYEKAEIIELLYELEAVLSRRGPPTVNNTTRSAERTVAIRGRSLMRSRDAPQPATDLEGVSEHSADVQPRQRSLARSNLGTIWEQ